MEFVQFRKKPSWITCLASFLCACGLFFLATLSETRNDHEMSNYTHIEGFIFTLIAGCSSGIFFSIVRPYYEIPLIFHWYCYSLGYFLPPLIKTLFTGFEPSLCQVFDRFLVIIISMFWCFANGCSLFASQTSIPSVSFVMRMLTIVISYILQLVFLDEPIILFTAGAVFVVFLGVSLQGVSIVVGRKENIELQRLSQLGVDISLSK